MGDQKAERGNVYNANRLIIRQVINNLDRKLVSVNLMHNCARAIDDIKMNK